MLTNDFFNHVANFPDLKTLDTLNSLLASEDRHEDDQRFLNVFSYHYPALSAGIQNKNNKTMQEIEAILKELMRIQIIAVTSWQEKGLGEFNADVNLPILMELLSPLDEITLHKLKDKLEQFSAFFPSSNVEANTFANFMVAIQANLLKIEKPENEDQKMIDSIAAVVKNKFETQDIKFQDKNVIEELNELQKAFGAVRDNYQDFLNLQKNCGEYIHYLSGILSQARVKKARELTNLGYFDSKTDKPTKTTEEIEKIVSSDPKVKDIQDKFNAVTNLNQILSNTHYFLPKKLEFFKDRFEAYRPIIEKRRDSAGQTFLKVIATILSGGLAYKKLWEPKGKNLISKSADTFFSNIEKRKSTEPQSSDDLKESPSIKKID